MKFGKDADLETRVAAIEAAVSTLVKVLAQPGSSTARILKTSVGPDGAIRGVPELFESLAPFARP